jgi:hypothetical protein
MMQMNYSAMSVWIEEAKKADYFTEHFVTLSKMIMNGTTSMARGLVTLHSRGEDPGSMPMSIKDLIGVASYHFRKSYLGVLQTAQSHPEISARLLVNQLSWSNTMLRLYKTEAKLAKPAEKPSLASGDRVSEVSSQLPQAKAESEAEPFEALPASGRQAFTGVAAVFEPSAYSSPRPYTALGGNRKGNFASAELSSHKPTETMGNGDGYTPAELRQNPLRKEETSSVISKAGASPSRKPAEPMKNGDGYASAELRQNPLRKEETSSVISEAGASPSRKPAEPMKNGDGYASAELSSRKPAETDTDRNEQLTKGNEAERDSCNKLDNRNGYATAELSPRKRICEDGRPLYLKIIQNGFARCNDPECDSPRFTIDEIRLLAEDPDFNRIYPMSGANIRMILAQIDTT